MFSQNLEEQYILDYFKDYPNGTFLSVGENDGVTFSNVRALALRGWSGVMIEPSPKAFAKLKELYSGHKGIYCYPYAISDHNGKAMLQESSALVSANDVGLVSTFHGHEMDRFKKSVKYEPVEVKTFKWKTFVNRLKSTRLKDAKFDFVSMDCEGDELNILPDMDLSDVKCFCIEWNGKPELKEAYDKYMNGFKVIYTSGENIVYAR